MCLFLQTQNFQQVTAALVTDMHSSSAAANASLASIRSDLHSQSQALAASLTALSRLQAVQSEVEAAVQQGLQEVKAVGAISQGLVHSMDRSLNMTVRSDIDAGSTWGGVQCHMPFGLGQHVLAVLLVMQQQQLPLYVHTLYQTADVLTQSDLRVTCCHCCCVCCLPLQGALSNRHDELMQGFDDLEASHQQHAARARQAFDQLVQEAAALEQRQARYEALQVNTGAASGPFTHTYLLIRTNSRQCGWLAVQTTCGMTLQKLACTSTYKGGLVG